MKIGIVVPYFTPFVRGNEYGLAEGLAGLGHEVVILASTGKAPREKMVTNNSGAAGDLHFKVRYLRTWMDKSELPFTPSVMFEIFQGGFDVLLLQEDYQPICHMAATAAWLRNVPTVLSTERTYYPAARLKRIALRVFDRTINAFTRRIVTVYTAHCTAAKEFVEQSLRIKRGRVRVIHVGVDAGLFKRVTGVTPLAEGGFKVLTVARLHPYKGLDTLIRAMEIVRKARPDVVLYIMGRGPAAAELKELASTLKVADVIRFVETPVPNQEMPPVYSSADLYIQPSLVEPYGIAVLEAAACGKPAICSDVGGMRDTVVDGETGFLVPPADPEALAQKILLLTGNRQRLDRMGIAARNRVEAQFDWPGIARQYQDIAGEISGKEL